VCELSNLKVIQNKSGRSWCSSLEIGSNFKEPVKVTKIYHMLAVQKNVVIKCKSEKFLGNLQWKKPTSGNRTRRRRQLLNLPSIGGFSGIACCTPSIASQWVTTAVSSGALGRGASITCK
jgi:hypothetical protein